MAEPLPDTWHNRDLPVLREAVKRIDAAPRDKPTVHDFATALNIDEETTRRSLTALERDGLVTLIWEQRAAVRRRIRSVADVSADAYRKAGAWPTPESGADRLIAALEHIAANTNDEDERTRAQKILDGFAGSGRQIAVGVATAIINGQVS